MKTKRRGNGRKAGGGSLDFIKSFYPRPLFLGRRFPNSIRAVTKDVYYQTVTMSAGSATDAYIVLNSVYDPFVTGTSTAPGAYQQLLGEIYSNFLVLSTHVKCWVIPKPTTTNGGRTLNTAFFTSLNNNAPASYHDAASMPDALEVIQGFNSDVGVVIDARKPHLQHTYYTRRIEGGERSIGVLCGYKTGDPSEKTYLHAFSDCNGSTTDDIKVSLRWSLEFDVVYFNPLIANIRVVQPHTTEKEDEEWEEKVEDIPPLVDSHKKKLVAKSN